MKFNFLFTRLLSGSFLLANLIFFTGCDPDKSEATPAGAYETGVFVINEGNFTKGNGAISYYDPSSKKVETDIFKSKNGRPLGDVVQSLTFHNDKGYIVVNNSNKIEIVNAATFDSAGVIKGLAYPRYFAGLNNKGYVTEWVGFSGNGRVAVIDLTTKKVTKTISVGSFPEKLLVVGAKLFVTNAGSNTISVINTSTDAIETTITVSDSPNSLVLDANNKIWVLAGGKKQYNPDFSINENTSTVGNLIRINPINNAVEATLPFASRTASPDKLVTNSTRTKLLYSYTGKIYQTDITATALPTTPFISRNFYGLNVDGSTNTIYAASAGAFSSNGKAIRYSANGAAIDSFETNIGPNGFTFK